MARDDLQGMKVSVGTAAGIVVTLASASVMFIKITDWAEQRATRAEVMISHITEDLQDIKHTIVENYKDQAKHNDEVDKRLTDLSSKSVHQDGQLAQFEQSVDEKFSAVNAKISGMWMAIGKMQSQVSHGVKP